MKIHNDLIHLLWSFSFSTHQQLLMPVGCYIHKEWKKERGKESVKKIIPKQRVEANRLAQQQQHHGMAEATIYRRAEAQKKITNEKGGKKRKEIMRW